MFFADQPYFIECSFIKENKKYQIKEQFYTSSPWEIYGFLILHKDKGTYNFYLVHASQIEIPFDGAFIVKTFEPQSLEDAQAIFPSYELDYFNYGF